MLILSLEQIIILAWNFNMFPDDVAFLNRFDLNPVEILHLLEAT